MGCQSARDYNSKLHKNNEEKNLPITSEGEERGGERQRKKAMENWSKNEPEMEAWADSHTCSRHRRTGAAAQEARWQHARYARRAQIPVVAVAAAAAAATVAAEQQPPPPNAGRMPLRRARSAATSETG